MQGSYRVNRVAKAVEEEKLPLEWSHANFVDGSVDKCQLFSQNGVKDGTIEHIFGFDDIVRSFFASWLRGGRFFSSCHVVPVLSRVTDVKQRVKLFRTCSIVLK